uniref:uncharacterized protein LOC120886280 n=1 Tax=Ictidomys tridecemlineatus TaxID=43179 RepID=UPI001A9FE3FD|nr:uncharacterized protein LOC120886280 [Ictidomys tridecemlineatus]
MTVCLGAGRSQAEKSQTVLTQRGATVLHKGPEMKGPSWPSPPHCGPQPPAQGGQGPGTPPQACLLSPAAGTPPVVAPQARAPSSGLQGRNPICPSLLHTWACLCQDQRWPGVGRGVIVSGAPAQGPHPGLAGLPALGQEFSFHPSSVTSCRSDFDQVSICLQGDKKKKRILLTHTVLRGGNLIFTLGRKAGLLLHLQRGKERGVQPGLGLGGGHPAQPRGPGSLLPPPTPPGQGQMTWTSEPAPAHTWKSLCFWKSCNQPGNPPCKGNCFSTPVTKFSIPRKAFTAPQMQIPGACAFWDAFCTIFKTVN